MNMEEKRQGNVLILVLSGELMGGDESKDFQDKIYNSIKEQDVQVVVDMRDIKWMNSSGLGILMAGLTTLRSSDGDLRLAHVSDRVRRPIEVTKLDQVIRIFDTIDDAVHSFAEEG